MSGLDLAQRAIAVAAERAVSQRVSVARHEALKYRRDIDGLRAVAIAASTFVFHPTSDISLRCGEPTFRSHKQINGLHARGLYLLCDKLASECAEFWI